MLVKKFEYPVDAIAEYSNYIIICSYSLDGNIRTGKIQMLDKTNLNVLHEILTTGTLHAIVIKNKIFAANSRNISLYEDLELKSCYKTKSLNTFLIADDTFIYSSNINGEINIFDHELTSISVLKITEHPIWILKKYGDYLFIGDESGSLFKYDSTNNKCSKILKREYGIIEIYFENQKLILCTYGNFVEIFNLDNFECLKRIETGSSIWRISRHKEFYVCACMYDGLKVFDVDFNLIKTFQTDSICYGLCMVESNAIFSSFYEKIVCMVSSDDFTK